MLLRTGRSEQTVKRKALWIPVAETPTVGKDTGPGRRGGKISES